MARDLRDCGLRQAMPGLALGQDAGRDGPSCRLTTDVRWVRLVSELTCLRAGIICAGIIRILASLLECGALDARRRRGALAKREWRRTRPGASTARQCRGASLALSDQLTSLVGGRRETGRGLFTQRVGGLKQGTSPSRQSEKRMSEAKGTELRSI